MKAYGEIEFRLDAYWTTAHDDGECLAARPGRFNPGEGFSVPIGLEAGCGPVVVRRFGEEKTLSSAGNLNEISLSSTRNLVILPTEVLWFLFEHGTCRTQGYNIRAALSTMN